MQTFLSLASMAGLSGIFETLKVQEVKNNNNEIELNK